MASIFSKIAAGEIPSYKCAESDKFYAFLDISPIGKGHTLVIPRKEVDYIFDMEDADLAEFEVFAKKVAKAIKAAFGDHAKKMVVNSTKSMTGHLLGGAGGVESVFTVLALCHQKSPPTINLDNQDPECDLDYCANVARDMKIDVAMKNNFGFGGTNGTLIFRRI